MFLFVSFMKRTYLAQHKMIWYVIFDVLRVMYSQCEGFSKHLLPKIFKYYKGGVLIFLDSPFDERFVPK